jgi:hypothetical protein
MKQSADVDENDSIEQNKPLAKTFWLASAKKFPQNFHSRA